MASGLAVYVNIKLDVNLMIQIFEIVICETYLTVLGLHISEWHIIHHLISTSLVVIYLPWNRNE